MGGHSSGCFDDGGDSGCSWAMFCSCSGLAWVDYSIVVGREVEKER